ncbi:hypothetical protein SNE40_005950 [Patella caerulea]|uniref:THAP-type domain-containing protein n=1 Tax=Patella caerulea TaxID=87958 RepID=A0AAN8K8K8_PATCE
MVVCALYGCPARKSKNRGLSFHHLPKKNPEWKNDLLCVIRAGRAADKLNEENLVICSRHFTPDCFEGHVRKKTGLSYRILKPGSIPTLNLHGRRMVTKKLTTGTRKPPKHFDDARKKLGRVDRRKPLKQNAFPNVFDHSVSVPQKERPASKRCTANLKNIEDTHTDHSYASTLNDNLDENETEEEALFFQVPEAEIDPKEKPQNTSINKSPKKGTSRKETLAQKLLRQNSVLQDKLRESRHEKRKMARERANLFNRLTTIFSLDQLKKLSQMPFHSFKWSEATYRKAFQLRFTCGTTGYEELLRQSQPFPSLRSLRSKLQDVKMEPGLLYETFELLKLKVKSLSEKDRNCVLTLCEIALNAGYQYDKSYSCIRGSVTLPGHSGVATHGLVFTLGGISTRWKQVVAYHFTGDRVDGTTIKPIILEIIKSACEIGLHVSCVTSDMGSSNRAMQKAFGIQTSVKSDTHKYRITHPCDPNHYLYFIFNVPHLTKNIKCALVSGKEFTLSDETVAKYGLKSNIVSLNAITHLVEFQLNDDSKITVNLQTQKLKGSHFDKMNVSRALNRFSNSLASGLRYLVEFGCGSDCLLTTAWFVEWMDHWFDLMTNRHPVMALSLNNLEAYNSAINHLRETIDIFKGLKVGKIWKPWQTGVILSTTSVFDLQADYLQRGHAFLLTGRLTQDCLENLFGCIPYKNPTPDALEFRQALQIVSVAQYMKCPRPESYLEDDRTFLADYMQHDFQEQQEDGEDELDISGLLELDLDKEEESSLFLLAEYCLFAVRRHGRVCDNSVSDLEDTCKSKALSSGHIEALKRFKEFIPGNPHLTYCSDKAIEIIRTAEAVFRANEKKLHGNKLVNRLRQLTVTACSDEIKKCHDIRDKFLTKFFTVRLRIHANKLNTILKSEKQKNKRKEETAIASRSVKTRQMVKSLK